MKNIKKLLAFVAVLALALTGVFALVACTEPHECGHVCPVEGCGKCLDKDCDDPACADKCQGHEPVVQPHVCGHVCPVEGCGKCLDKDCNDSVCADKCQGHTPIVEPHVCGHVCETCGKCTDANCENAACADKCQGHTLAHVCGHVCETCGKCTDANCENAACADKCQGHDEPDVGYTITLVVGDGTLEEGASLTYKTGADGKLSGYLPEPEANAAHWSFDNWYDAETGGNAIDETVDVFTEDTTIYARYIREDGVWLGDVFKAKLSINDSASRVEYWLGGSKITLAKGDVMSLYIDGKLISHHVEPNSAGVTKPAEGTQVSAVTVSVAGPFAIYLHKNASDWSCEYSGPTEMNTGSEVPEGCDEFKVTIGTNVITFYLVDGEGKAVGKSDFSKFCIYTYEDEIFGIWADAVTQGVVQEAMTGAGTAVPSGWIFRWGSNYSDQTANIIGLFQNGKTYLVELPAATNGSAKVTEIILTKYDVTLDLNYEGQPEEKEVVEVRGGKIVLPANPTREGYDFVGWYTEATNGTKIENGAVIEEDTTIYAHWTEKIKITLNYNYEGCADSVIVSANYGKLSPLPTATREGYYLIGWFTAATEGTKITVDTVFNEDTTIYAQWGERVDATVTVNYNYEGCADPETITITAANGNLIVPFPTAPVREGYKFLGWYTTAVDTEDEIGELVTAETEIHADTTIYARYATVHTLTIVVDENGSLPEDAVTTYEILDGKVQFPEGVSALPTVTVSKAHWSFKGWYNAANVAVNVATAVFDADTTLTAKVVRDDGVWKGETFVKALVRNSGASREEYWLGGSKITLAKGDVISIYMNGIVINHYVEPNSAGIEKPASSAVVGSVKVDVAGEFQIYLHKNVSDWSCEYSGPTEVIVGSEVPVGCDMFTVTMGTNKINFFLKDVNGNPVSKADFSKFCIYTYQDEIFGNWAGSTTKGLLKEEMTGTLTAVPNGWIFRWGSGYGQQTSNLVGAFKAGKTYLVELKGHQQGATITELTITSIYTITFDQNYEGQPETKVTGRAYNGKLTNLYTFTLEGNEGKDLYWYTAAEGGERVTFNTVFTADTTIYARWIDKIQVTPNYNYEDCDTADAITIDHGKFATLPVAPAREGYDFLGWYTLAEGGEQVTTSYEFAENASIYAHWRECLVITVDQNYDGQPETKATVTIKNGKFTTSNLPAGPTREGYEFLGWFTEATEGDRVSTSTVFEANATIYAQWRVPFQVTLALNYEDCDEPTIKTANVVSGQTYSRIAALPTEPVREGYEFVGWYNTAAATGGTKLSTTTNITSNVTYYARWTALPVVSFDLNDGEEHETNATLTVNAEKKLTAFITEPTREGYDFAGWYDAAEGGNAITLDKVYTADVTIYAHWTAVAEEPEIPETEA